MRETVKWLLYVLTRDTNISHTTHDANIRTHITEKKRRDREEGHIKW